MQKGGQKGSNMVAFFSSSSHNIIRVSLLLLYYRARGRYLCSGRVRWWCGRGMRVQRGAVVGCGLIYRGVGV
jgi:hypothetical protein